MLEANRCNSAIIAEPRLTIRNRFCPHWFSDDKKSSIVSSSSDFGLFSGVLTISLSDVYSYNRRLPDLINNNLINNSLNMQTHTKQKDPKPSKKHDFSPQITRLFPPQNTDLSTYRNIDISLLGIISRMMLISLLFIQ